MLTGTNSYRRHDGLGRHPEGTTASLQGNILNNATVPLNQPTTAHMPATCPAPAPDQDRHRHADPDRHQQLHRRHDGAGGVLQGNTPSLQGNILNNAIVVFDQTGIGTYAGIMSGTGSMTLQGGGVLTLPAPAPTPAPPPSKPARCRSMAALASP